MEDARLSRRDPLALLVEHERLRAGDRLPHRGRLLVEQLGLEVAHALALREAVHPEDERVREDLAQRVVEARRERGRGVRHALDALEPQRLPLVHADERRVDGRHAREDGDLLLLHPLQHLRGIDEGPLEHERRAHANGHEELVEAVVEGEREDVQDPLLGAEAQVLAQAARGEHHVAVSHHHALRVARAARGVDERGEVERDRPRSLHGVALCQQVLVGGHPVEVAASGLDHALERGHALGGPPRDLRDRAFRDDERGLAVVEDVRELVLLRLRVDDDEDAARDERPEDGDDAGERVVREHDHAVAALEALALERRREAARRVEQLRVREPLAVDDERGLLRRRRRGRAQAVVQQAVLDH